MFITHTEHDINVKNYCDLHLRKMIIEQAQMLSTAHRVSDGVCAYMYKYSKKNKKWEMTKYDYVLRHLGEEGNKPVLYMMSHKNHPNNIWIRESVMNYKYAYSLFIAMLDEYVYRFDKKHESQKLVGDLKHVPRNIKNVKMTPFVYDKKYQYIDNVVDAYRKAFVDKFRDWSNSNMEIIYNFPQPSRKRMIHINWTRRDIPSFIDDETLDMINSYHPKRPVDVF